MYDYKTARFTVGKSIILEVYDWSLISRLLALSEESNSSVLLLYREIVKILIETCDRFFCDWTTQDRQKFERILGVMFLHMYLDLLSDK